MRDTEIEVVVDAKAAAAEGPLWDSELQRLTWVDVLASRFYAYYPKTGQNELLVELDQPIGAVVPRSRGGFVVTLRDGFGFLDEKTGSVEVAAQAEVDRPENRFNDAKCDAAGRLWSGSFRADANPTADAALYRLDPDLTVTKMIDHVDFSNGMGWSPDHSVYYYVDTTAQRIDAFDYDLDTGNISNRRTLVEIDPQEGNPDGLCVDAEGYIWLCLWDGWQVRRYAPDGRLDGRIEMPAKRVTSCAFGGPDLTDLYITTARVGISDEELQRQPHAGGVFRVRPGVKGLPTNGFAG